MMLTKVLTALWVAPVLIVGLFAGGILFSLMILAILIVALQEYAALVGLRFWYHIVLLAFALGAVNIAIAGYGVLLLASPFVVFLAATLVPIFSGEIEDAYRHMGAQ